MWHSHSPWREPNLIYSQTNLPAKRSLLAYAETIILRREAIMTEIVPLYSKHYPGPMQPSTI